MPIRPSERARYPKDWKKISLDIRRRSWGRCECIAECGLHPDWRCFEISGLPALYAKGRVVLTVAHLDHQPETRDPKKLKAMCQRCHLRYDTGHHVKNARITREQKKEMTP